MKLFLEIRINIRLTFLFLDEISFSIYYRLKVHLHKKYIKAAVLNTLNYFFARQFIITPIFKDFKAFLAEHYNIYKGVSMKN